MRYSHYLFIVIVLNHVILRRGYSHYHFYIFFFVLIVMNHVILCAIVIFYFFPTNLSGWVLLSQFFHQQILHEKFSILLVNITQDQISLI